MTDAHATDGMSCEAARLRARAVHATAEKTLARVHDKLARASGGKPLVAQASEHGDPSDWDAMAQAVAEAIAKLDDAGRAIAVAARAGDRAGASAPRRSALQAI